MKTWPIKKLGEIMKFLKWLSQVIKNNYRIATPIVSGGVSLAFLEKIIFSPDLEQYKFQWGTIALIFIFISSAILYYLLNKLEKDKDVYLISSVGKIVEDVFAKYGVSVGSSISPGSADAEKMNLIMQTIVNHLKEMLKLADKKYKD